MMRYRALGSPGELCCLPSPYRIPQRVAGMAFNFSKVELAPKTVKRALASDAERHSGSQGGERSGSALYAFGLAQYSPAT